MFASGHTIEENRCFCEDPDKCREGGVINVSKCRRGAPIMMSAPHFYLGEEKLVDDIEGLAPVKEKHETFLDVMTVSATRATFDHTSWLSRGERFFCRGR